MNRAIIYTRSTTGDHERQRDAIVAKFGDTHEIVAEYRDDGTTASVSNLLEESGAEVLLCADLTRLGRRNMPEIVAGLQKSGLKVKTISEGEISMDVVFVQLMPNHTAKTESQRRSERIKRGIEIARQH